MRKLFFYVLLFTTIAVHSQELNDEKTEKIRSLEVDVQKLNLHDVSIQKELNLILKYNRKSKKNKTVAIVFTSISVLAIIGGGISLLSNKSTTDPTINSHDFGRVFSGITIGAGVFSGVISVPFWILSNKRKKQRDQLIENYK